MLLHIGSRHLNVISKTILFTSNFYLNYLYNAMFTSGAVQMTIHELNTYDFLWTKHVVPTNNSNYLWYVLSR